MKRLILLAFTLLLASCTIGSDYSARSTVYGWIDVDDLPGNSFLGVYMRQYSNDPNTRFFPITRMNHREFAGGYIYWNFELEPARYELSRVEKQTCIVLACSRINQYEFGAIGQSPAQVNASSPGVYYAGKQLFSGERAGIFEQGNFQTRPTSAGPTQAQMLDFLIRQSADIPVVTERLRASR